MFLDPTLFSAYLIVSISLAVSPGPDFMYVLANGLKHKAKGAIAAVLGIAAGSLVHSVAVALKDFALSFRRKDNQLIVPSHLSEEVDALRIFKQGLITNILNPKMIVFFISLLPQFVSPDLGHIGLQLFTLGAVHNVIGSLFLIVIGVGSGNAATYLMKSSFGRYLNLVAGAFFIGLAVRLFFYTPLK